MKANRPQLDKALKAPAATRLFLFHGPDEAGSEALARRVGAALEPDAERIALSGTELKGDPARLSDEAASLSMFGSSRWVLVSPAGDDVLAAAAALLSAPAAGNPVVLVAGALKATSRLLKLAVGDPGAIAFASYPPDARDFARLVGELARARGLTVQSGEAQRLAEAAGGNRAILEQELDKFAAYLDAAVDRPAALDHDVIAALGAALDEGDTSALIEHVFSGNAPAAQAELARLRGEGVEGITLLRAGLRRAVILARLRSHVDQGQSPGAAVASHGRALFWKEKDAVERQISQWDGTRLARCLSRLTQAERDVKKSGGVGPVAAEAELLMIARQASRR